MYITGVKDFKTKTKVTGKHINKRDKKRKLIRFGSCVSQNFNLAPTKLNIIGHSCILYLILKSPI